MTAGTVAALWRYPVKSMLGEELDASSVGERGLAGDRAYALIDRASGKVVSGKNPGRGAVLLECRAVFLEPPDAGAAEPPPALVTLPDGSTVRTDDADVDDVISRSLNRAVWLRARAPEPAVIDDEPIALLSPPGTFFDAAPVHVVTTASLDALAAAAPAGRFDPRRFRPNILVATDAAGFVDNAWVDTTLRVGTDVALHLVMAAPRCVMTTLAQDDLPADTAILRTVSRANRIDIPGLGVNPCVGVYGLVTTGGAVALGDDVQVEAR
jgi:MOSC domain-containing protein